MIKKKHKFGEFEPHDCVCPYESTSSGGGGGDSSANVDPHGSNKLSSPSVSRENSVARSCSVPPTDSSDLPETAIE
jgi:hypothetical protein